MTPAMRLSIRADSTETVYHNSDEATAWFEWDRSDGIAFNAHLLGVMMHENDELLTPDQAVERFGLEQVRRWEQDSVDNAKPDDWRANWEREVA